MKLTLLILLLPLAVIGQTVTNVSGLAWCYAHGAPVTMVTNKVIRDVGTAQLGGVLRTQTLDLRCPRCKVRETVTRTIWIPDGEARTNRFQDRRIQIKIPKRTQKR